jgi:hypothetical protein
VKVRHLTCHALVDSGNVYRTAISEEFAKTLGINQDDIRELPEKSIGTASSDGRMEVLGETKQPIRMQLGGHPTLVSIQPAVIRGLAMPMNISGPTLRKLRIDHLYSRNSLRFQGRLIPLVPEKQEKSGWERTQFPLHLPHRVEIPAMTIRHIDLPVPHAEEGQEGFVVGNPALRHREHQGLPWTEVLVKVLPGKTIRVGLCNPTEDAVSMRKGTRYGDLLLTCTPEQKAASPFKVAAITTTSDDGKLTVRRKLDDIIKELEKKRQQVQEPEVKAPTPTTEEEKRAWLYEKLQFDQCDYLDTDELKEQAMMLLLNYWDVMSVDGEFGNTQLIQHEIHTPGARPIKCKMRPINPALRDSLKDQLNKWLEEGVIEPSQSPWSFPLVAAPKKNQTVRWCIDFRRLNDVTTKDAYMIPTITENLDHLGKSWVFSSLDGAGAFHNISIRKQDQEKTAFGTPFGSFQFRKLPFGLTNGPASYQRLIDLALTGVPPTVALPYLDDILVHSPTVEQHFVDLERILHIHRKAGLKLQPAKCHLFRREVEYLGTMVSGHGRRVPPGYVDRMAAWRQPDTRTGVRAFLGAASYYRTHVKNFSHIAGPLHDVTGKAENDKEKITMSPEMVQAFETLKKAMTTTPIMAYPRFGKEDAPFILDTDFSYDNRALGGVLSQIQENKERVIIFGGKKLCPSQMNYSATKGELTAFLHFCNHWRHYLLYRKFVFRTDHQPLVRIHKMLPQDAHTARMLTTLADFDFEVKYRPGKSHGNADAMSRAPHLPEARGELGVDPSGDGEEDDRYRKTDFYDGYSINALRGAVMDNVALIGLRDLTTQDLARMQEEDEDLGAVIRMKKESPDGVDPAVASALPPNARTYIQLWPHLEFDEDNVLRYKPPSSPSSKSLFCVPEDLQLRLITAAHAEGGHAAGASTALRLRESVFFPDLTTKTHDYIKTCLPCQQKNNRAGDQRHTLFANVKGYPFQQVSIDFVGPLPTTRRRNKYILTCRDVFSKWLDGIPVPACTAKAAARALTENVFCRYGLPESMHSDQGSAFMAECFQDLAKELGIKHTVTPAYNPKSSPVERAHRDLGAALRALIVQNEARQTSWEDLLQPIIYAMNTTVSTVTGYTPFRLMFGRDPNTPLHLLFGRPDLQSRESVHEYVAQLQDSFVQAHKLARGNIARAVERRRRQYNEDEKGFSVGQRVWLFSPVNPLGLARKLTTHWTGPWTILERLSPLLYRIKGESTWNIRKLEQVVSVDRLKLYNPPIGAVGQPPTAQHDLSSDSDPFAERPFPVVPLPAGARRREVQHAVADRVQSDDELDDEIELDPAALGGDDAPGDGAAVAAEPAAVPMEVDEPPQPAAAAAPAAPAAEPEEVPEEAGAAATAEPDLENAAAAYDERPLPALRTTGRDLAWDPDYDFSPQDTRTPAQLRAAREAGRRAMRAVPSSTRSSLPASTPPSTAPSTSSTQREDTPASLSGGTFADSAARSGRPGPPTLHLSARPGAAAHPLGARPRSAAATPRTPAAPTTTRTSVQPPAAKQLRFTPTTARPAGPAAQHPLPSTSRAPPPMFYSPSDTSPLRVNQGSPRQRADLSREMHGAEVRRGARAAEQRARDDHAHRLAEGAAAAEAAVREQQATDEPRRSQRNLNRRQQQQQEEQQEEQQQEGRRRRYMRDGDDAFVFPDWRKTSKRKK